MNTESAQGTSAEVGEAFLTGFAGNGYVAPMLLVTRWERLDLFYGTNDGSAGSTRSRCTSAAPRRSYAGLEGATIFTESAVAD